MTGVFADAIALGAVLGAAWCGGVGYSAYRAVGWVERIRAWAHEDRTEDVPGLAGLPVDGMGWN